MSDDGFLYKLLSKSRAYRILHGQIMHVHTELSSHLAKIDDRLNKASRDIQFVTHEQSQLHTLVTSRLTAQLEHLNRSIYFLKRDLYHSGVTIDQRAFNSQFSKHRIFRDLCIAFAFEHFVETGAHTGNTTRFLSLQGKPVYSVEIDPAFFEQARQNVQDQPNAHVELGDSTVFLSQLFKNVLRDQELSFIYLDAHWGDRLPLREELNIIACQHPWSVVMIDDFKVEDDPGYGYDTYSEGQEITISFLQGELQTHAWQIFFPTLPSSQDLMMNDIFAPRGTAVMAVDPVIVSGLARIPTLRQWRGQPV